MYINKLKINRLLPVTKSERILQNLKEFYIKETHNDRLSQLTQSPVSNPLVQSGA